ncbi:T9SS type A sorting domain-containing protein [Hymenobacter sp. BT770]|uniref:T9SS type A sorting domain-containing protein n=1 Tax=Hymenobacter sp. BT770 TaxID=2886942 RepID=UPI001D129046|nr:T9SS type A sorting domain-containing protein [Hymenobacter sp. BT770]MCC3153483.1 T9SS type A sorting domain-containing protein [Hymenobacter sp. BT770]MDO3415720.1 T9SS type A sorting domain-containing protein [Hymenobacter sp. BT770]
MKKVFTLVAAGALTVAGLSAQAQITLDGKVTAAEIATTPTTNKYQLVSTYAGTHSIADRGLKSLYMATSATKLYIAVVGAFLQDNTYPAVVMYLNVPGKTGVPAGTKLAGGAAGDSPLKIKPTMDFEVDYGVRVNFDKTPANGGYFSFADYSGGNVTGGVPDTYQGNVKEGTAGLITATATTGPLLGARVAYTNATGLAANTDNSAIEFEFDLAALGLTANSKVDLFVAYTNDGGVFTTDTFPPIAGQTTALAPDQDFTLIPGKQFLTYQVGAGVLASRSEVANSLRFGVYPNPGSAVAVSYTVPQGKQAVALSVYDATGKQVRSMNEAQTGTQSYKLGSLSAGIYVVKLNIGGEQTSSKIVIE